MTKNKILKSILCMFLCVSMLIGYVPVIISADTAVAIQGNSAVSQIVTDKSTASTFESILGTDADGARYAGRVWVDKSVYKNGDIAVLNSKGNADSSFEVSLESDEAFQIIFSALGSTVSSTNTVTSAGPMDIILVIDNSSSMEETSGGVTRMDKTIDAANTLLADLLDNHDVRLGIVAYGEDASTVLPFGKYTEGVQLQVSRSSGGYWSSGGGVITAHKSNGNRISNSHQSAGYANYTNTQEGFALAMEMFAEATNTNGRKPIVILLTDGAANTAYDNLFVNGATQTLRQIYGNGTTISPAIALSTILNTAYNKARIAQAYGVNPQIYGIGVDLSSTDGSNAIIDPGTYFNAENTNANVREAYAEYLRWVNGETIERSERSTSYGSTTYRFRFGQDIPQGITKADIIANINYIDTYYAVTSSGVMDAFDQIYQQISSAAFNPITSGSAAAGGTGVEGTPLIFADFIGEYMEIKEIQAITVFGQSFDVIKNANGTYTVEAKTGYNPTTNEYWSTADDIRISVIEQADGTQKLEIRIYQEILPIILREIDAETVGDVTSATMLEFNQDPLRVYYTVGIDSDILLPNGEVDIAQLVGYDHIDNGVVSLFSNQFCDERDAHVGFQPAKDNRYYYYQKHHGIFTQITDKQGRPVSVPENEQYGLLYDEDEYNLHWMTYEDYLDMQDTDKVYTYVTYYRHTPSATDAYSAAEEVTYLVYMEWKYLEGSVTFYDANADAYLNNGEAIPADAARGVVATYIRENPNAEIYASLGIGAMRTSRLHNMIREKAPNLTGTEEYHYYPEYLHEKSSEHYDNDVIVWLGNNGRIDIEVETGIVLTKAVTEAIGNPDDTYEITVEVLGDINETPVVTDVNGNVVAANFNASTQVLTVNLKADETVYIHGIPEGTVCEIDENVSGNYHIANKTDRVVVPTVEDVLAGTATQYASAVVTNAPNKYGNLFITKEVVSEHTLPTTRTRVFQFEIEVNLGIPNTRFTVSNAGYGYAETTDANGVIRFRIGVGDTFEIFNIPAGTNVTVTEVLTAEQQEAFTRVTYRARNHSGEAARETNNAAAVTIPETGNSTVVITNEYTPLSTTVDMDVTVTKDFDAGSAAGDATLLPGGSFTFIVEKDGAAAPVIVAQGSVAYSAGEDGVKATILENILANETFTKAGTYNYRIKEVKGSFTNVTYDRTVYVFGVNVTDKGGYLEARVVEGGTHTNIGNTTGDSALDFAVRFENTYDTAIMSIEIKKEIENYSGDASVNPHGFKFTVKDRDTQNSSLDVTLTADTTGFAQISKLYTRADLGGETSKTFVYIVEEVQETKAGWTYTSASYNVYVRLEDVNGELVATITDIDLGNTAATEEDDRPEITDNNRGKVYFTNTYDPEDARLDLDGHVRKELTGKSLEDGMFTFYVYADGDRTTPILTGTNLASGYANVDFNGVLEYSTVGTRYYDIVEDIPAGAVYDAVTGKYFLNGMGYDAAVYDLVVDVKNNANTGALTVSYFFEDATSTTVTFSNIYRVTPTTYTLGAIKRLDGRAMRNGEFEFELYEGRVLKGTATNRVDGTITFDTITYTQAGVYTYTIVEKEGSVPGVTYGGANTPITVTVTVEDVNGELIATADKANADMVFQNTYTVDPAKVIINGIKEFVGGDIADTEFSFKLYETGISFNIGDSNASVIDTVINDAAGSFRFEIDFRTAGTYYFVVAEDSTSAINGVVYDNTLHRYVVTVRDNGLGQLVAAVTDVDTGVETEYNAEVTVSLGFVNTYDPADATLNLDGIVFKSLTGKELKAGDFTFYVYENGSAIPVLTGTNGKESNVNLVNFDKMLTFTQAGRWVYKIVEDIPDGAVLDTATGDYVLNGMHYDATEYILIVSVTDDKEAGKLVAAYRIEGTNDKEITFYNAYITTPGEYTISGIKDLIGRDLVNGEFEFELYEGNTLKETVKNNADGSFTFSKITYTQAGVYTYTVKEKAGSVAGVTYGGVDNPITVVVTVTDVNGELIAEADVENDDIVFENTYLASSAKIIFNGLKTFIGGDLEDYTFTFDLYLTDESFDITKENAQLVESATQDENGEFRFVETLSKAGTYYVVITEKAPLDTDGVEYDDTQYKYVITVTDAGLGQLTVAVKDVNANTTSEPLAQVTLELGFTNELIKEPEIVPPVTGDSTRLYLILVAAVVSLGALITLGAYAKRKNEAEEN